MPTLPTQSFQTLVANTIVGIQGRASQLLSFSIGSTLRAIAEGFAGVFLWFQAMVLQLLTAIRLSTASGLDVDTFTADFMPIIPGSQSVTLPGGSPRLAAFQATGQVIFSQLTPNPAPAFIPVGTIVMTFDGSQKYAVVADPTYATYSTTPVPGGYNLVANVGTITVPVQAVNPGSGANAAPNSITVINANIPTIDAVTNASPFINGEDQETDSQLKKRFSDYIMGLSRGDIFGLQSSVEGVGVTVQWTLNEDYNLDGSWRPGFFFVVADDGSGSPPATFMTAVTNAANAVRPLGIQCAVFPPTIIQATVAMQVEVLPGYDPNVVVGLVGTTIANNINSLGLGFNLPWTLLSAWAYSVAGVTAVLAVTLNGKSGDTATLVSTIPTNDGLSTINIATIKCQATTISLSPVQPNILLN